MSAGNNLPTDTEVLFFALQIVQRAETAAEAKVTEAKPLHVCSVGPVSTRHAVVCVFLAFIKITISPLSGGYRQVC